MGHPAHFHLFKNTIILLKEAGHDVKILIKKKDILEDLLKIKVGTSLIFTERKR